ncbi:2-keto-3-deoxy-L-rhamnonate aldolase [Noviherbaspirillum cavernae]|uniref:2-keto-3-deoxy-L-rhamnonate aldolase n=1 Tax=Noviherbaspirillum cavernae TaxID=2320862 RepID=A0A418WV44_9BURK|nr:HpcH/HpaI aldolase/citrate lyase family protein [Noviherbaspirillum cavernae]RJF96584.1 2-keto-3-deoxy-L-rhamnonate aldolase [Noviherbaspirillum cavernae]
MDMPLNSFKRALAAQQTQIGLFLGLANPLSTEILAGCGFDFLLIDGEHGPNDLRSIQAQLQAMAPYPVQAVVRPPSHDVALIKQLLGIGVQTLLVPMVHSAEQARTLVQATRYPPVGIRGVGTALERGARWNGVANYLQQVDAETCLIVQVESQAGLDALDDILQVDGIDGVFLGPSDLAASMGHLGNPGHADIKSAIEKALARIAASGKAPGVFASDVATGRLYQASGARFFSVGVDTLILRNAAIGLVSSFRTQTMVKTGAAY